MLHREVEVSGQRAQVREQAVDRPRVLAAYLSANPLARCWAMTSSWDCRWRPTDHRGESGRRPLLPPAGRRQLVTPPERSAIRPWPVEPTDQLASRASAPGPVTLLGERQGPRSACLAPPAQCVRTLPS